MEFSLPGQLRGPECKRVMQQAIVLRKNLEPWFGSIESNDIQELCIVLRVDGSLGSFGVEGVENVLIDDGTLACDVVIADHKVGQSWMTLKSQQSCGNVCLKQFQSASRDAVFRSMLMNWPPQWASDASRDYVPWFACAKVGVPELAKQPGNVSCSSD